MSTNSSKNSSKLYPSLDEFEDLEDFSFSPSRTENQDVEFKKDASDSYLETENIKAHEVYEKRNLRNRKKTVNLLTAKKQNKQEFFSSYNSSFDSFYSVRSFTNWYEKVMTVFDDNISNPLSEFYEEKKSGLQVIVLTLIILLIFIIFWWWFLPLFNVFSTSNVKEFRKDVQKTVKTYFKNDKHVAAILTYIFNLIYKSQIKTPVTVLLIGQENNTNHFILHFQRILRTYFQNQQLLDISFDSENAILRQDLEDVVYKFLEPHHNRLILLRKIDAIVGQTPLFLQTITDPDQAPYKQLILLATLSPTQLIEQNDLLNETNCNEKLTRHLLQQWGNELKPDKIYPIISRISALLLCFN